MTSKSRVGVVNYLCKLNIVVKNVVEARKVTELSNINVVVVCFYEKCKYVLASALKNIVVM